MTKQGQEARGKRKSTITWESQHGSMERSFSIQRGEDEYQYRKTKRGKVTVKRVIIGAIHGPSEGT